MDGAKSLTFEVMKDNRAYLRSIDANLVVIKDREGDLACAVNAINNGLQHVLFTVADAQEASAAIGNHRLNYFGTSEILALSHNREG